MEMHWMILQHSRCCAKHCVQFDVRPKSFDSWRAAVTIRKFYVTFMRIHFIRTIQEPDGARQTPFISNYPLNVGKKRLFFQLKYLC